MKRSVQKTCHCKSWALFITKIANISDQSEKRKFQSPLSLSVLIRILSRFRFFCGFAFRRPNSLVTMVPPIPYNSRECGCNPFAVVVASSKTKPAELRRLSPLAGIVETNPGAPSFPSGRYSSRNASSTDWDWAMVLLAAGTGQVHRQGSAQT